MRHEVCLPDMDETIKLKKYSYTVRPELFTTIVLFGSL